MSMINNTQWIRQKQKKCTITSSCRMLHTTHSMLLRWQIWTHSREQLRFSNYEHLQLLTVN